MFLTAFCFNKNQKRKEENMRPCYHKAMNSENSRIGRPIVFVDQLQGVDSSKVTAEHGEIYDQEAAKRFGVRLQQEFSFWGWRSCGIANITMILYTEGLFQGTLYDLVCQGLHLNGYAFKSFLGKEDIGWRHEALCQLLHRYGINVKRFQKLNITNLVKLIFEEKYVIASITSKTGGHMVLVKDYIKKFENEGEFIINDPYVFKNAGGENIRIKEKEFAKIYLERGIVTWSR